ncbi:MAG TPA: Fic family protein [Candidatus Binataceae bacterium]|nr:Fic family protein [Candidatus Binataceae bacterium]
MAKYKTLRWKPNPVAPELPRRARIACDYAAYLPDLLATRTFTLEARVAADISDAERGLARLNDRARALVNTEALARLLLRAESVASSRIEGLEVGPRRLLRADIARQIGEVPRDVTALEVLANIDAMTYALDQIRTGKTITVSLLTHVHKQLLAPTRLARHGGVVRTTQNWIGGNSYNPCNAEFVPPPPEHVQSLLKDLCDFSNAGDLPALAQAAIAHAQFETIHPFVDGNGRVGRALIHMILRRRGLAVRTLAPISLILATRAKDYVMGLTATRYVGPAKSEVAADGVNTWVSIFVSAAHRAVNDASQFEARIEALQRAWRVRLTKVRLKSAVDLLLETLPGVPILTVQSAAKMLGRSDQATNEAVARLVDIGILRPRTSDVRRNRVFEATEVVDAFADLERQLASPAGDTKIAEPSRRVPRRRRD